MKKPTTSVMTFRNNSILLLDNCRLLFKVKHASINVYAHNHMSWFAKYASLLLTRSKKYNTTTSYEYGVWIRHLSKRCPSSMSWCFVIEIACLCGFYMKAVNCLDAGKLCVSSKLLVIFSLDENDAIVPSKTEKAFTLRNSRHAFKVRLLLSSKDKDFTHTSVQ